MLARRDELQEEDPPIEALRVWVSMRELRRHMWDEFQELWDGLKSCFSKEIFGLSHLVLALLKEEFMILEYISHSLVLKRCEGS